MTLAPPRPPLEPASVIALFGISLMGCGANLPPGEKPGPVTPADAGAALVDGLDQSWAALETAMGEAGVVLDSTRVSDWPRSGDATLTFPASSVGVVFTVDRTQFLHEQRVWSVELALSPLVEDGVTFSGWMRGTWEVEQVEGELEVHHLLEGELRWAAEDPQRSGSGEGDAAVESLWRAGELVRWEARMDGDTVGGGAEGAPDTGA
jgi:hypothetical protein